jgi:hypothetical protein
MARIVRIHEYGDPSVLKIEDIEVPPPGSIFPFMAMLRFTTLRTTHPRRDSTNWPPSMRSISRRST